MIVQVGEDQREQMEEVSRSCVKLVLLSVVFLDQCEISVRLGDPTVQKWQAGSLPTAARSLDRLCSFPWLIIAVSVGRRVKRVWR